MNRRDGKLQPAAPLYSTSCVKFSHTVKGVFEQKVFVEMIEF
jgi:hypothetical protein